MQFSSTKLFHGFVSNTLSPLYQVKTGEKVVIKNIFVQNIGNEESQLDLYVAKNIGSVDSSKSLFSNAIYKSGERENISELFVVLEPGDIVFGVQTKPSSCVAYISGVLQAE